MLAWCWGSNIDNKGIEEYNNELLSIQEQAVESLRSYYEGLEKDYDGSNLITMFTWTLDELSLLKKILLMNLLIKKILLWLQQEMNKQLIHLIK